MLAVPEGWRPAQATAVVQLHQERRDRPEVWGALAVTALAVTALAVTALAVTALAVLAVTALAVTALAARAESRRNSSVTSYRRRRGSSRCPAHV